MLMKHKLLAMAIASACFGTCAVANAVTAPASAASERRFTIAMTDLGEIHFLPRLMRRLAELAPGVTISTVRNTAVNLSDDLESGRVDIAIGLLPQLKAGFFQRHLFRQRYVCIFREGHVLDKDALTLQDFEAAQHVVVVAGGTGQSSAR